MSSPCDFVTTPDAHRPGAVREGSRSPPAGDLELQPSAASLDRKTVTMKDPRHGTCVALPMRPMPKHPTRISALLGALALHSATVACTSDVSLPAPGAAVPAVEKAPATVSRRADVNALKGWRRKLYGEIALDVKHGKHGSRISETLWLNEQIFYRKPSVRVSI